MTARAEAAISFVWGLAEATVFFIIPDVFLTLVACRSLRRALEGTLFALAGALVGGTVMFSFGLDAPERARALLDAVPAIQPGLIADVRAQLESQGLLGMALGPARGTPYKIYAVEWGACGGRLLPFLLVSVPARWVRFALTVVATRGAMRLLEPWTQHRAGVELTLVGLAWVAVYAVYFAHFGW
jgi:membrane protein YqaA with SNARE-associated domain